MELKKTWLYTEQIEKVQSTNRAGIYVLYTIYTILIFSYVGLCCQQDSKNKINLKRGPTQTRVELFLFLFLHLLRVMGVDTFVSIGARTLSEPLAGEVF